MIAIFNKFIKHNKKQTNNNSDAQIQKAQLLIYAKNIWEKQIKVGDKVIIRIDIEDGQTYGQFTFRDYMEQYRGMTATVISKKEPKDNEYLSEILLDIDKGENFWDVTMFNSVLLKE